MHLKKYALMLSLLSLPCFTFAGDFILGLNLSSPIVIGGTAGYRFNPDVPGGKSLMIEAEAGIGGGKLLLGMDGMNDGFGTAVKVALLKTWIEPINVEKDQTYMGVELQAGYSGFYAGLGGYGHIAGDDGDSWITTLSLGIRF